MTAPRQEPHQARPCKFCGDLFVPRHGKQLYDSYDCKIRQQMQVAYERRQAERAKAAVRALQPTK